ncbi:hypothetical protein [Micromonospora sp. WMMD1082]|uniref:hypothetical protein n=1 Tax=Micromonospora sp. WMMD1082 TaxID=3016104 RepID=UPI00241621C0|nr:hypothetical protein [Micromonospora sp. WMMD1082]MDG4794842.1 hypothetical protein [Micromonospora sp. WMMD1082]
MTTRGARPLTVFTLVVLLSGCSIGDVRRTPPPPEPPPSHSASPGPPPTPRPVAETRSTRLAVPARYDSPFVEFVDAERGYALYAACDGRPPGGPDCRALLWSTRDGGRSWQRLRHPRPVADNQQLYATVDVLALWAEPHGWWTSTDGGETFRHSPGEAAPASWQEAQGRFQIIESSGEVGRWVDGVLRPLPAQPPVPVVQTVTGGEPERFDSYIPPLIVAGLTEDGGPAVAVSWDGGRDWQSEPVPPPEGEIGVLRAAVTPDERWLIGERPDRTGFPALWVQRGPRWLAVAAEGHPELGRVVPLGGSTVAVIGPRGAGAVIGDRYLELTWPVTAEHSLRVLADGTLFAATPQGVLLGSGRYVERTWTAVTLETD